MLAKVTLVVTLLLSTNLIQVMVSTDRIGSIESESLQVFHPEDAFLKRWFDMTSDPSSVPNANEEADFKLRTESCNETVHAMLFVGSLNMCDAYDESEWITGNCPAGLLRAECRAVYMYSTDFYETYNTNIRAQRWDYYKIFTSLLYNALVKLAQLRPLPENTVLYRGMKGDLRVHTSPLHFTQFVSTSLDLGVAEQFGNGTLIRIKTNDLKQGALLYGLVKFEIEREVLLSPFETFDVINQFQQGHRTIINLKSSSSQQLLNTPPPYVHDELYLPGH